MLVNIPYMERMGAEPRFSRVYLIWIHFDSSPLFHSGVNFWKLSLQVRSFCFFLQLQCQEHHHLPPQKWSYHPIRIFWPCVHYIYIIYIYTYMMCMDFTLHICGIYIYIYTDTYTYIHIYIYIYIYYI